MNLLATPGAPPVCWCRDRQNDSNRKLVAAFLGGLVTSLRAAR